LTKAGERYNNHDGAVVWFVKL